MDTTTKEENLFQEYIRTKNLSVQKNPNFTKSVIIIKENTTQGGK